MRNLEKNEKCSWMGLVGGFSVNYVGRAGGVGCPRAPEVFWGFSENEIEGV